MAILGYTGPGAPAPGSLSAMSFLPSWSTGASAFTGISTPTMIGQIGAYILRNKVLAALPSILPEYQYPGPQLATFKSKPAEAPVSTISPAEMAAIDEAIRTGTAISVPPITGRELFGAQAGIIIGGEAPPQPRVLPGPVAGTNQSSIAAASTGPSSYESVQGGFGASEDPLNLSGILGGIFDIAQTYSAVRNVISPPPVQYAPPVMAAPPQPLAPTPAAAFARTAQLTPGTGLPIVTAGFPLALAPLAGGALSTLGAGAMSLFSSVGKVAAIAAATGLGIDVIDGILKAGSPKRRRRRMLTKSDTADIATMAALLGKGSESFKTWLAIATRR